MAPRPSGEGGTVRKLLFEIVKALAVVGLTLIVVRHDWLSPSAPASAQAAAPTSPSGATELVTLDPFVVNVASAGASAAYVRATVAVALKETAKADLLRSDELTKAKLRAALLEELSVQSVQEIVTAGGRAALAARLEARAGETLGSPSVDVLITDFVAEY